MVERASVSQQVQIGVESTPGTNVAADKLLTAMGIELTPNMNFEKFAPMGLKYDTLVAMLQEWSTFSLKGVPTYTEIVYPLSSVLTTVTPSTTTGVTTWTFTPSTGSPDTVKTFTIQRGSSVQAEKVNYGIISEFNVKFSPTASDMGGSGFAKALQYGITMTPTPTSIGLQPILPINVSVYLDTTSAGLGTTKLTRVLSASWNIKNRRGPLFVVDGAQSSFVADVELKPEMTIDLSLEMDSAGVALVSNARAGDKRWLRIEALGITIPSGTPTTPFTFRIDAPVEISSVGGSGDQDGVYKMDYTFDCVHDATWGQAVQVVVKNNITAL